MKLLETILLADDFSKSSKNVVNAAVSLARVMHSKTIPIHVLPDEIVSIKVKSFLEETAHSKLTDTLEHLKREGLEVGTPILKFGSISDSIVRASLNVNANLIVVGSGESQKDDRFQLGTTTKQIIQKSEKPVFVVKEDVPLNVRNILCPVDFSETSKRALKNAITMAHRFKAELTILSVCELQGSKWFASEEDRAEENKIRHAQHQVKFDDLLKKFNLIGLNWTKEIPLGQPYQEILKLIGRKSVDLLIMGTTGRTGLNRLIIGSVTEKVVREVPCSFLTLKSEDLISLKLEKDIKDIEKLYKTATQLMEDGFYEEAIEHFKSCLSINNMHVPAYFAIAKVYDKINQPEKAKLYQKSGRDIKDKMLYSKIEEEVRKLRGS